MKHKSCRFCGTQLKHTFVDLGVQPLCQSIITEEQLNQMEPFYPLHAYVCHNCFLVQLEEYVSPTDIFSEYAYFSSYSDTWLDHSKRFVKMITEKLGLNKNSFVIEIASNDGYLLQYFLDTGISILGIEPAANVAKASIEKGVPTLIKFFSLNLARELVNEGKQTDLIIGNNVLAQVPTLNDFVEGINVVLKTKGVATLEFPHLMKLMEKNQFDTIYHEHFSYFSFTTVEKIFAAHNMKIYDVDELSTHGGSIRIYAAHVDNNKKTETKQVENLRKREENAGITDIGTYSDFSERVKETKRRSLELVIKLKRERKSIAGYGAPGKGNTFLNYAGIRTDFLDYVVDRNPYKQGNYLPGTHIPVFPPEKVLETRPDYLLILPWNLKDEIMKQNSFISNWGGKFIIMIPNPIIIDPS